MPAFAQLALPAAIWVSLTSLVLLISRNWRWSIVTLALQYVGVFGLVALDWPLEMAAAKMVGGWMAGAVLGAAAINTSTAWRGEERLRPSGRVFRLSAAALAGLVTATLTPRLVSWAPGLSLDQAWGAMILMALGLLHLGLTAQPLRVILGLLTVFSGFEIIYASVEASTLVAGLLAGLNLALALVGAYLLLAPEMESDA